MLVADCVCRLGKQTPSPCRASSVVTLGEVARVVVTAMRVRLRLCCARTGDPESDSRRLVDTADTSLSPAEEEYCSQSWLACARGYVTSQSIVAARAVVSDTLMSRSGCRF
jgi:hypothetical protein